MLKDNNKALNGGDFSSNHQADRIEVNNYGLSYSDAKEIALDVYKSNIVKLSDEAAELAAERVKVFISTLLNELVEKLENLNSFKDPGFQSVLFSSQREYAKTGDKDLGQLLVDLLVNRASEVERTKTQIIYDEALDIAPKLTATDYDILSIIFLLRNFSVDHKIADYDSFKDFINQLCLFVNVVDDKYPYTYLEYAGCVKEIEDKRGLSSLLIDNFSIAFCTGFNREMASRFDLNNYTLRDHIIPCFNDKLKYQFSFKNKYYPKLQGYENEDLKAFYITNLQKPLDALKSVAAINPLIWKLNEQWKSSEIKHLHLTNVGIAIAIANIYRRAKIKFNLEEWNNPFNYFF
jgi:hypothetical protein